MKTTVKKAVVKIIIVSMVLFSFVPNVSSHTTPQSGIIEWNEKNGWVIRETDHTNSTTVTYMYPSSLSSAYRTLVTGGSNIWNNNSIYTVAESGSGTGNIYAQNMTGTPIVNAIFTNRTMDANGHLTYWEIIFNTNPSANPTAVTFAHEVGHAFGLNDLYESANYNKLMCGIAATRTATVPHDADKKGVSVITGQHTSHSWTYRYFDTVNGHKRHRSACSGCWGWEYGSLVTNCTYSNAYCIYCGTHV